MVQDELVYDILFYIKTKTIELEPHNAAPTEIGRYTERFDFICCQYIPGLEIRSFS